jgi:hypothetical protein
LGLPSATLALLSLALTRPLPLPQPGMEAPEQALTAHLRTLGVNARVVHEDGVLHVYCTTKEDLRKVPLSWENHAIARHISKE